MFSRLFDSSFFCFRCPPRADTFCTFCPFLGIFTSYGILLVQLSTPFFDIFFWVSATCFPHPPATQETGRFWGLRPKKRKKRGYAPLLTFRRPFPFCMLFSAVFRRFFALDFRTTQMPDRSTLFLDGHVQALSGQHSDQTAERFQQHKLF